ncbi:MAG: DMT family transporter [Planctomycetota bacterium]
MGSRRLLAPVLVISIVSISTAAPLIKLCDDAAPAVIAAARMGLATVLLVPIAGVMRGRRLIAIPRRSVWPIVLGGLFLGAHFYFWISSLKYTSVLSSVVIVTTNPIFVALASRVLFKERVGLGLVYGIAFAIVGGALIAFSDAGGESGTLHGDLLALCGAVMASCYLLTGRRVRRDVDTFSYILPVYMIAALLLCAIVLVCGETVLGLHRSTYVYLALLAIVPQLVGHSAFNWALRHLSATFIAMCILGEPIGACIFAHFIVDEAITAMQVVGGSLILAGIFLAARAQTGRSAHA